MTTLERTPILAMTEGINLSTIQIQHCFGHLPVSPSERYGTTEVDVRAGKKEIHSHDCFEITYILEGSYDVHANGKSVEVGAYDLILYSPHCKHGSEFLSSYRDGICIWFDAKYPVHLQPCFAVIKDPSGSLRWLFERALQEYLNRYSDSATIINALLSTIILYSNRMLREMHSGSPKTLLNNIIEYINFNYYLDLSISNLANIINVSKSHFHKLFREATGTSPLQYINRVRIEHAKTILKKTDASILEVAFAVGFEDARYFSRLFKKHTGVSPNKYRQAHGRRSLPQPVDSSASNDQ